MKTCKTCLKEKPFNEFNKRKDSKDGFRSQCKNCRNKQAKKNRIDKILKYRINERIKSHKRRTKIKNSICYTLEELNFLLLNEGGFCFWCGKSIDKYHLDHIFPISSDFEDVNLINNICISCENCNLVKSNKNPINFVLDIFCGNYG